MVKVLIIGAGISGLCAARLLSSKGIEVTVLEARDRVGGRTHTVKDASYGYTDLGGAYVGTGQRRIGRLARELGVEFYKVDIAGKTLSDIDGMRMTFQGIPPILNPIKAMDLNNVVQKLNKMAKQVPIKDPWNAPNAEKLDSMTFQQFIDETCWTNFAKETAKLMVRAVLCGEPCEISLLSMLWYIHSAMSVQKLIQIPQGAQELKILGGAQEISNKMAEELKDHIKLSETVIRIQETEDKLKVTTSSGNVYAADYVISGMPQTLLNRVEFIPPLPPLKLQMTQRIPMGSIIKTVTFYKTAFWKDKGLSGEMSTNHGPVLYCIDDTKPDGSHPALMGFVLADRARQLTLLTPYERKTRITEHYARVFKCDEFLKPINYVEKDWMADEYAGGCYVNNYPPGVLTRYGDQLRQCHGRVHFAGTESASMWAGYMDGAVQAGERAASEVMYALGLIAKHEVNMEEIESPDFPDQPIELEWIEKALPSVGQFLWAVSIVGALLISWGIRQYKQ